MKKLVLWSVIWALLFFSIPKAESATISLQTAYQIARNWLKKTAATIDMHASYIEEVVHYQGGVHGDPGYYIAFLRPSGWLCIPADDSCEPIRAYGKNFLTPQNYEISPLKFFLRLQRSQISFISANSFLTSSPTNASVTANKRWELLNPSSPIMKVAAQQGVAMNVISNDIVVNPLLGKNSWGQGGISSSNPATTSIFYNRHVAWNGEPFLVGSAPLSLGQFLRYNSWGQPAISYGKISINGVTSEEPLFGHSTAYQWNIMDPDPHPDNISTEALDMITGLLHDTGAVLNANYNAYFSGNQTKYETYAELFDIPDALTVFGYRNAIYAPYGFFLNEQEERKYLEQIILPNLVSGMPVFLGLSLFEGIPTISSLLQTHTAIIDGYAFHDYGPGIDKVPYHHINFGWNGLEDDFWFALTDSVQLNTSSYFTQFPYDFVFNVMSDDEGKELVGGRFYLGDKESENVVVTLTLSSGSTIASVTNTKGAFAARIPPNTTVEKIKFQKTGAFSTTPVSLGGLAGEDATTGESVSWDTVGNRWWGDISLKTATTMGVTTGIEEGLARNGVPYVTGSPRNMSNMNFDGMSSLYVAAFPFANYASQTWLPELFQKIEDFVRGGGTAVIEADSWLLASRLASAAGGSLTFYSASEVPIYYGAAGRTEVYPKGQLLEDTQMSTVILAFSPYEMGSGGPLIKSLSVEGGNLLANAEVLLFTGNSSYTMIYPVSVCFPLGAGMVYYTSFPIPGAMASTAQTFTIADWYLSRSANSTALIAASIEDSTVEDNTGGCNGGMGFMALVGLLCLGIARKR